MGQLPHDITFPSFPHYDLEVDLLPNSILLRAHQSIEFTATTVITSVVSPLWLSMGFSCLFHRTNRLGSRPSSWASVQVRKISNRNYLLTPGRRAYRGKLTSTPTVMAELAQEKNESDYLYVLELCGRAQFGQVKGPPK